jgi:hypothetical protein
MKLTISSKSSDFDAHLLYSGIYFVRLNNQDESITLKLVKE